MKVFSDYARYYDLLYRDKNYQAEAGFVRDQLARSPRPPRTVLELGCGTGRHAVELARLGLEPAGIDLSENMVAQAQAHAGCAGFPTLQFACGDVRQWRGGSKWDAVISLFHVMSYQTSNADLLAAVQTAGAHLDSGGLFFFDFWYGPAVLTDPPATRVKRMSDGVIDVVRVAEPVVDTGRNQVTVHYEVLVTDRQSGQATRLTESHQLRYLFLPELEFLLDAGGFDLTASGAWMSADPLSAHSWYGWALACKR